MVGWKCSVVHVPSYCRKVESSVWLVSGVIILLIVPHDLVYLAYQPLLLLEIYPFPSLEESKFAVLRSGHLKFPFLQTSEGLLESLIPPVREYKIVCQSIKACIHLSGVVGMLPRWWRRPYSGPTCTLYKRARWPKTL